MDDPQSEADKIRNKRLAKLAQATPSVPATPISSITNGSAQSSPLQASSEPPVQASAISAAEAKAGAAASRKVTIKPRQTQETSTLQKPQESIEFWIHKTLCSIFRVTLRQDEKSDSANNALCFLPDLKEELEENGAELFIQTSNLDQVIIEAASHTPDGNPFKYLLGCWKRVMRLWNRARSGDPKNPRYQVIKEAKRLCLSYCIFAATMPDMFDAASPERSPLVDHLLDNQDSENGLCHDFLSESVARFSEDESIKFALVTAIEQLSAELRKLTMNDNYKPYIAALRSCARYPPLAAAITESPKFIISDVKAERIEHDTLLGPFFALSPLHPDVAVNYFMGASVQGPTYVSNNQEVIRSTLRTHQDELFEIANAIIKSAKQPRERMLDWFALTVNKNHKRRATWVNSKEVASDGFMVNVTTILDRLCEPFMDSTFSKIDRIDVNYLRRNPRVEIADETKINADQKESDEFYAQKDDKENNFISEIFFLTVAAHHYGSEGANHRIGQLERESKHFEKEVAKFEAERPKFTQSPPQLALFEARLKEFKNTLERLKSTIESIKGILLDRQTQERSLRLMRYIIAWLLRLIQPESDYPKRQINLPLGEDQPLVFRCLPEYLLEDIVDNFKFVTQHMPDVISVSQCEELVTIAIVFLRNSEYVRNPYLKSGLVSILFHGVWGLPNKPKGILGDLLTGMTFCQKHLLHALMKFYIEAESTGGHNQFYDKFNIRYEIFQVIRCIWSNPAYRENLSKESKVNPDFFVRFVNLLLNDVTYVLGEGFRALNKIHDLQLLLEDANNGLDETQKQEKQEALEDQERMAKANIQLTNETVSMLKLFTDALAEAFTSPEIVQRLADMLDYNLEAMVGDKQRNLKVKDEKKYYWNPKQLLADLIAVYINLKDQKNFQIAVARDGRSYKDETFKRAGDIMSKTGYKSPEELTVWRKFAERVRKVKEEEDQAEEDLGEIPDEFLDPILYTLMEDPVQLPVSKIYVDRSSIRTHLLSDPHDPFNRVPLKIEDVLPAPDLMEKINNFKAQARNRKSEALKESSTEGAAAEDKMDLTE